MDRLVQKGLMGGRGGGGPDAMQVKGAAKTPPGREHLSRAHYYPNTESNKFMRILRPIEEVMSTAIGKSAPFLTYKL